MYRTLAILAAAAMATVSGAASAAQAEATAQAPAKLTVADTPLGTLLDNPAAKAVLARHVPDMIANPQIDMARGMSLKQLQTYAADALPDAKLDLIQADLDKLPAK